MYLTNPTNPLSLPSAWQADALGPLIAREYGCLTGLPGSLLSGHYSPLLAVGGLAGFPF
jgi:hypothetical protein